MLFVQAVHGIVLVTAAWSVRTDYCMCNCMSGLHLPADVLARCPNIMICYRLAIYGLHNRTWCMFLHIQAALLKTCLSLHAHLLTGA